MKVELLCRSVVVGLWHDGCTTTYAVTQNSFFLVHYLDLRYSIHDGIPLPYFHH